MAWTAAAKSNQGGIETGEFSPNADVFLQAKSNQGGIETLKMDIITPPARARQNRTKVGLKQDVPAGALRRGGGKIEPRWD